jgi:flagellar biosynthesis chaperone FliJ
MNSAEQIKMYQQCRSQVAESIKQLSGAAGTFYQQLLPVNKFISMLPNTLMYRKNSLQRQSMNVIKIIDNMIHDAKQLDVDCSLQIQALISKQRLEKSREEHTNEKRSNAKMARQSGFKRSQADG